jgi:hypothetical protein
MKHFLMKLSLYMALFFAALLGLSACLDEASEDTEDVVVEGLRPVYAPADTWRDISAEPARPVARLGKIYYKHPYIFVNELYDGIHIFDNTNPLQPVRIKFIQIKGNEDIAIKDSLLYANNATDLVVLDISDLDNIRTVGRKADVYGDGQFLYPNTFQGFFECVEPSKGKVIGWEKATLLNPKCWR